MRLSEHPDFNDAPWRLYETSVTWPISYTTESEGALYVQYRDWAGNASQVYSDTYLIDTDPPLVYIEVEPKPDTTAHVHIYAYDELSALDTLYLSNDPWLSKAS